MGKFAVFVVVVVVLSGLSMLAGTSMGEDVDVESFRYASHDPIKIDSDADFDYDHGVIGGSGTENSPYVIANWIINAKGYKAGIYIGNTTKYFKILNCVVSYAEASSGFFTVGKGVAIHDVAHAVIQNLKSTYNTQYGIYVEGSQDVRIEGATTYSNGYYGIYVSDSTVSITGSTISDDIGVNKGNGIRIEENTIKGSQIYIQSSDEVYVANNTVKDFDGKGVYFSSAGYHNIIYGNNITNVTTGIYITSSIHTIVVKKNVINGGDNGIYLYSTRNMVIEENIINSTGKGAIYLSWASLTNVNGNELNSNMYGIYLKSSESNTIKDNKIKKSYEGIHVEDSDGNAILNNSCLGDGSAFTRDGVYVKNSENVEIYENHCSWLSYGVDLYRSDSAKIHGNILDYNSEGIAVSFSNYTEIFENEITNSRMDGIKMEFSNMGSIHNNSVDESRNGGILIYDGKGNVLENNTLTNSSIGIYLYDVSSSIFDNTLAAIVKFNHISGNNIGILVDSSSQVLLYHNDLVKDVYGEINVSSSNWVRIENQEIYGSEKGISIWESFMIFLQDVVFRDNEIGLYAGESKTVNVENVKAYNNTIGILAYNSSMVMSKIKAYNNTGSGIELRNNCSGSNLKDILAYDNGEWGLKLSQMVTNVDISNSEFFHNGKDGMSVNGTYLHFAHLNIYENHYAGVYFEFYQHLNFEYSNITYNNYEGLTLPKGSWYDGGYHTYISKNGTFNHLNVSYNGKNGILLKYLNGYYSTDTGHNFYIKYSIISHNQENGIYVSWCYHIDIFYTTLEDNQGVGIVYDDTEYSSVGYNNISGNKQGGIIFYHVYDDYVYNNTILHNEGPGILYTNNVVYTHTYNNTIMYNEGPGILYINGTSSGKVYTNTVAYNQGDGIRIENSRIWGVNLEIYNNLILNNAGYGIYIHNLTDYPSSNDVLYIYENSFYYNNGAGDEYDSQHIQAYDDGVHHWNGDEKGNFWAEWTEPDRDGDGIVDEPYIIEGGNSKDNLPLAEAEIPIPELQWMVVILLVFIAAGIYRKRKS